MIQTDSTYWSFSLNEMGGINSGFDDVSQSMLIILNTVKGSNPLRPDFGSDIWRFVDMPINVAIPMVKAEIIKQIGLFEPRAEIKSVTHELVGNSQVVFTISWVLRVSGQTQLTEFLFNFMA